MRLYASSISTDWVFNIRNELIYPNERLSKPCTHKNHYHGKIRPSVLRLLYHDNHVVLIDKEHKFEQFVAEKENKPSPHIHVPKPKLTSTDLDKYKTCQCTTHPGYLEQGMTSVHIVYNQSLKDQLTDAFHRNGINPEVNQA